MNPTNSQIQIFNSENFPPSLIPIYHAVSQDNNNISISSQSNLEQITESSAASSENICHVISTPPQANSMQSAPSYQPSQTNSFGNPTIQRQPVHPNTFIYRPPNEYLQYHVSCEKISNDLIIKLLRKENIMHLKQNEYVFFYKQQCNDQIYQVSCEIISPSFINNYLNKNIHGIEIEQNMGQEQLALTFDQGKSLELHLLQYLNNFFLN
ncbi:5160_t:CDS:1 [Funneliformis caledonium]|uniref:5160_t:CDS:1 n=1 Tax=Funneliformis caledonium TaxID=1117310 RepID=A0A9N9EXG6_9GLOM|nr:5160_t:CDS:1 [Funneliformis caledonium]